MALTSGDFSIDVNIAYVGGSSPGLNRWHFETSTAVTTADADAKVTQLKTFYTAMLPYVPSNCTFTIGSRVVAESTKAFIPATPQTAIGTAGTTLAPTFCSLVMGVLTGTATRSGHGRVFLGPFDLSEVQSDATPTNALVTAMRTAGATLVGNITNGTLCVYSRKDNTFHLATGVRIYDRWGVLRSRR